MLRVEAHPAVDSRDSAARNIDGNAPRVQFDLRSHLQLPRHLELDSSLSRVGALSSLQVPAYTRVDVRIGRDVGESVEISAGAQNLLKARHVEFDASSQGLRREYVRRAIYGKVLWRF